MLNQLLDHRYKILNHLGSGGFGTTFLAQDTKRPGDPLCVVKQLTPSHNTSNFLNLARRLFQAEAETLEHLGKHPQIPQLLAYFEENKEFYLVQEYVDGNTLSQDLKIGQPWNESQVVYLLRDLLHILKFVHENHTIHRDIKPANIIRRHSDHKCVLLDFGAVKQIRQQELVSSTIAVGTPGYMAAEQGIGKPRPNSDIYALGIIAIQALTGLTPAPHRENTETGFRYDADTGEIIWLDRVKILPELAAIITKMVKPNFPDRYQSTVEVLEALKSLGSGIQEDESLIQTYDLGRSKTATGDNELGRIDSVDPYPSTLGEGSTTEALVYQGATQPLRKTVPTAVSTKALLKAATPTEPKRQRNKLTLILVTGSLMGYVAIVSIILWRFSFVPDPPNPPYPTSLPTASPISKPTSSPALSPTPQSTVSPTSLPTASPISKPTSSPAPSPTPKLDPIRTAPPTPEPLPIVPGGIEGTPLPPQ